MAARGFSLIELITVVALMAILVGAAYPTAAFLFDRFREDALKENLVTMRAAILDFRNNRHDDDKDGRIDEDPRGDQNLDGHPGIRGVDDDGDLVVDEDWGSRTPFDAEGRPAASYDTRCRADDDEDASIDEEAYPGDLTELASRMEILAKKVPVDPTTGQSAWKTVTLEVNNDFDYTLGPESRTFVPGVDPVVRSLSATFESTSSIILFPGEPPASIPSGTKLKELVDEDPRNGIDDDGDGRVDEDAPDLADVSSTNDQKSINLSPYSSW